MFEVFLVFLAIFSFCFEVFVVCLMFFVVVDVFLVCWHNRIDTESGFLFDVEDIERLTVQSDRQLPQFYANWKFTLGGMGSKQSDENLRIWLARKLRNKSEVMSEDLSHYDRVPNGHPDKTYEWLFNRLRIHVEELEKRNNRTVQHAAGGGLQAGAVAPGIVKKSAAQKKQEKADKSAAAAAKLQQQQSSAMPAPQGNAKTFTKEQKEQMRMLGFCVGYNLGVCKKSDKDCPYGCLRGLI